MEHVAGQTEFARLLASFRERARINLTELAKRLEVSRITVYRWEHGTFPKKESLAKFKAALRWADANGRVRYLDDSEALKLRIAAGYLPPLSTSQQMDMVEPADRCVAYSIRYSPSAFPSRWSWRVMEVEESSIGGVNTMWRGLPSITRPATFYTGSYYRSHYESGLLDAYAEAHKKRQELFERRLKDTPVQHIYERSQVEDYFTGDSPEPRLKSMRDFASAQIKQVLTWLQCFPDTFDVALTSRSLPANITIIANEVVLLEFPQLSNLSTTGGNLMGLEIFGSGAVLRFKDQFEAIWHDKNTTRERKDVIRQLESLLKNRRAVGRGS